MGLAGSFFDSQCMTTILSEVKPLVRRGVDLFVRAHGGHRLTRAACRRWPTLLAVVVTFDWWQTPFVPPVWTLLLCQAAYLLWGWRAPRLQLAVFGLYVLLAAVVIMVSPQVGVLLIALGWGAHAVWDLVHHVRNAVVPRWWSEWCGMFDLLVAVTILLKWF